MSKARTPSEFPADFVMRHYVAIHPGCHRVGMRGLVALTARRAAWDSQYASATSSATWFASYMQKQGQRRLAMRDALAAIWLSLIHGLEHQTGDVVESLHRVQV
jgi:hypothetical protein